MSVRTFCPEDESSGNIITGLPCSMASAQSFIISAMLRVIISGWPRIAEAGPILEKDAAFKSWLNRRLSNPSLATQDSAEIRDLARASCPKGADKVCSELLSAVELICWELRSASRRWRATGGSPARSR